MIATRKGANAIKEVAVPFDQIASRFFDYRRNSVRLKK
jgi:hypothetical protein